MVTVTTTIVVVVFLLHVLSSKIVFVEDV